MKRHGSLILIAGICLSFALLGGCSKKPVTYSGTNKPEGRSIDSAPSGSITEEIGPSESSLDADGRSGAGMGSLGSSADQNSDEYKRQHGRSSPEMQPVYFDFDQASIRGDQVSRIEHNADHLKNNPSQRVVVEGNCDERGTNEYNLALGERRAQNAKNYMIDLGVEAGRIRTVSFGEERPLFQGSEEDSWAQNRRDDFILE